MTKREKAKLVADLITGETYLCEACNTCHNKSETTSYWQGIRIGVFCPNNFSIKLDDQKMAGYVPIGIEIRV